LFIATAVSRLALQDVTLLSSSSSSSS
jgi:hypothetical protein